MRNRICGLTSVVLLAAASASLAFPEVLAVSLHVLRCRPIPTSTCALTLHGASKLNLALEHSNNR